jgi:hypothetical protein
VVWKVEGLVIFSTPPNDFLVFTPCFWIERMCLTTVKF